MRTPKDIKERLKYIKQEIIKERVSYGEIIELQALSDFIPLHDVLLREWAGLEETFI